jgi:small subunit ribosomal protein S27Ae
MHVYSSSYTKAKKVKAKHTNVKLATLKYYSVSDDGKVTRLRKPSPYAEGCWMATHFDRYTCGKTGQSFKL